MNKKIFISVLALVLVFGLGVTAYIGFAQGSGNGFFGMGFMHQQVDFEEMERLMEEQGVDIEQMYELMNSGDYEAIQQLMEDLDIDFETMLPYMQQMHPEFSAEDLDEMFSSCHGTGENVSAQRMMNF